MDISQLIDFNNIAALLPHSGRMILLDRIIYFDEDRLATELTVRDDGLLGDKHGIPAWAGIEYMAQAVGAYAGIRSKLAGEPIKLGYLLGTRRYVSNVSTIPVGKKLNVEIKKIIQDERLGVFNCKICADGIDITANLNVYQPPIAIKPDNKG